MIPTFQEVVAARKRIQGMVVNTPLTFSAPLSELSGGEVYLKQENLQHTGSFKQRGAANKMLLLSDAERAKGIITASAGNHAQGVANVAGRLGIDALIVIPENAPTVKVEKTRCLGARVEILGADFDESERLSHELEAETGRVYIHPFCDRDIMAGQGTAGLEMMLEQPELDYVLVPVGGGGLIAGVAAAVHGVNPNAKVIGLQPETSRPWCDILEAGRYVPDTPIGDSIADGLTGMAYPQLVPGLLGCIDGMISLSEDEISYALHWMLDIHHTVLEASAVVGVAALLANKLPAQGKKVGVVLSGSSIDTDRLLDNSDKYR